MFNEQEENTFLAVVDIQLRDGNPPEAKQTFDRLVAEGLSQKYARLLIGNLLARDIQVSLMTKHMWDINAYVAALNHLPDM
jgi:hypothetical protein